MTAGLVEAVSAGGVAGGIGRSLREGFYMFWDTLWALVVGFGLSGAVQAFVSRAQMQARLGDHGPAAVARATLYGAMSSSCSYAAAALSKSLFGRGADFVAAMVFMFASTNLVVELGIVLLVLIGWQFVVAEVVGGLVMIGLLVAVGGLWFRGRTLEQARRMATASSGEEAGEAESPRAWRIRIRTVAGWSDAASYTMSDLTMLRKELLVGFVVAGFVSTVVPNSVWDTVFLHGHGTVTTVENVVVAPLVALLSFVCSIGNIPLAAALWTGGIAFGGVVSFIFADLVALPLILVYRRMYGTRMALRMLAAFWLVMSVAGLVIDVVFHAVGAVPATRPTVVAATGVGLNVTTVLDVAALGLFAVFFHLHRSRDRLGGGTGFATDPVCGMQVQPADAPASLRHGSSRVWFCCEGCRDRFVTDADRYAPSGDPSGPSRSRS